MVPSVLNAQQCLELIQRRQSTALLTEPAPTPLEIEQLVAAAITAPDHHSLHAWRFIQVQNEARQQLGQWMVEAAMLEQPNPDDDLVKRLSAHPLRAPLILIATLDVQQHAKVPVVEQVLSLGAAIQNMLLLIEAQGYAAIWRTGFIASSPCLKAKLGLAEKDIIGGFIYIGTAVKERNERTPLDTSVYLRMLS